jgi:hypothetical protein
MKTSSECLCCLVLSLLTVSAGATDSSIPGRRLSYEWIAGYEPRTLVTDHAAIDLDQKEVEKWLAARMLDPVKDIYQQGGHSQSTALIHLSTNTEPPKMPIPSGTIVYGWTNNGDMVHGRLTEEAFWTSKDSEVTLLIEYQANEVQDNYVNCQVGGLVITSSDNRKGCK